MSADALRMDERLFEDNHLGRLAATGWISGEADEADETRLSAAILCIASGLGEVIPGRGRQEVERIVPQSAVSSYRGSLSSLHGLAPLLLHTDTAHWPVPCRYLVMACVDPGPLPAPTALLDTRAIHLTREQRDASLSAVFLIRNGRKSFYGTISSAGRPFIRFDLGCMEGQSDACSTAVSAYTGRTSTSRTTSCEWTPGKVLVIDNWRMLHGRGVDGETLPGRVLLRVMVR